MLFQLRLNCSARSHRLRWSPGDSTDLHNATQLAYIVYDLKKRDFRQFFGRLVTLLGRRDRVEEISVASKAKSSTHGFKSSAIVSEGFSQPSLRANAFQKSMISASKSPRSAKRCSLRTASAFVVSCSLSSIF